MDMFEIFPLKFYRSHLGYIDIVHQQNYAQFHIQPPGLPPPSWIHIPILCFISIDEVVFNFHRSKIKLLVIRKRIIIIS